MRRLCKVPRSEIPPTASSFTTCVRPHDAHMCPCVRAPAHNRICMPMCVCVHMREAPVHTSCMHTYMSIPTHTHTQANTCASTHTHTHTHTHTPHRHSISSCQYIPSCQAPVDLKFPGTGAPGKGCSIPDLQFVKWAGPRLCPDSSVLGPPWEIGRAHV